MRRRATAICFLDSFGTKHPPEKSISNTNIMNSRHDTIAMFETNQMKNASTKQIARQRIQILFEHAKETCQKDPQIATQYIKSARRIAMAAKIHLPAELRRQTCKKCYTMLIQGNSCRVRIKPKREPHVVITCLSCGKQTRINLKKKGATVS